MISMILRYAIKVIIQYNVVKVLATACLKSYQQRKYNE